MSTNKRKIGPANVAISEMKLVKKEQYDKFRNLQNKKYMSNMKQRGGGSHAISTWMSNMFRGDRKTIPAQPLVIQAVGDLRSPQNNLRWCKWNSYKVAQIPHDPDPKPTRQVIWNKNLQVDVFLKRIIKDNMDKDNNS